MYPVCHERRPPDVAHRVRRTRGLVPLPLSTVIRPYDWGSRTALPELLGAEPTGRPQAELWAGAHPAAPSSVDGTPLNVLIERDPAGMLGAASVARFGPTLPYLLKVLAVEKPLSLQVHPTTAQARSGFAAEEARGIPIDDGTRTYKDPFHKPEMVCALTDFHGLCGFRDPAETAAVLKPRRPRTAPVDRRPPRRPARESASHRPHPDAGREFPPHPRRGRTRPHRRLRRHRNRPPRRPGYPRRLLLNHVRLKPGEALFLDAGVPHSYLGGLAIEVMANSDNVLRCGLTGKHMDVPELMRVVEFALRPRPGRTGRKRIQHVRRRIHARPPRPHGHPVRPADRPPQTLLCLDGEARLASLTLTRGEAAFIPAGAPPPPSPERAPLPGAPGDRVMTVLALDIGGTKFAVARVDASGTLLDRAEHPVGQSPTATLRGLVADFADRGVTGIGIGSAGPIDTMATPSADQHPRWRGYPLVAAVQRLVPGVPVSPPATPSAWPSANGGAAATRLVPPRHRRVDRRRRRPHHRRPPWTGRTGNAYHIGHVLVDHDGEPCVCGARGCLETVACGPSMVRWALAQGWTLATGRPDAKASPPPPATAPASRSPPSTAPRAPSPPRSSAPPPSWTSTPSSSAAASPPPATSSSPPPQGDRRTRRHALPPRPARIPHHPGPRRRPLRRRRPGPPSLQHPLTQSH